ncbi:MAG: ABC transporter permease [Paludibacteraceae bacterium]|nr:ABC transporter permease [Paludibacteraceae bacterium]
MPIELKIAWRYLFAKKSHNAINIVSGVSAAGVAVATAALVCVLSVLNGFNVVLENLFSQFDPDILITPVAGKTFRTSSSQLQIVKEQPEVAVFTEMVEERAMLTYKDHQAPAQVMGVDSTFRQLTHIDSIVTDGYYEVFDGAFERCVIGRGLAAQVGVNAHFVGAVRLYAPQRTGRVSMLRPDKALNKETCYMAGVFAVNQVEYDDRLVIVSADCARRLFGYNDDEVTAVGIRVKDGENVAKVKRIVRSIVGAEYNVRDRYEQQEDFFRIARMEKLLCAILLVFILIIAAFNCVSSLSMLMLEKQADTVVLKSLGTTDGQIRRIFLYEGWLVSLLGALTGLVVGLCICISQEKWGWLKLGNGTDYVIDAYPVAVAPTDVMLITLVVALIGFIAAWVPARKVGKRK